ncbi:MAG: aspartate-semialdehyde dehydrogenase, partial [Rhodothermaceae bacterium]|nr:aspartate-semialdehyde dehydrogenase [Rhodothermaceae bacterium]
GILGATGAVGQTFVELLAEHPLFEIAALAASERSAGKSYAEAANWIGADEIPAAVAGMTVQECTPDTGSGPGQAFDCDLVFSGLDASAAGDIEAAFARAGIPVISNARNYRMAADVPLLIPEVNPDHTALIDRQDWGVHGGYIVTNPNCSTVGLVMALKPLHDAFGIEAVHVVTMQALSGAGYPGVPSLDSLANVVPHIGGEEEKMAIETRKLLGTLAQAGVDDAPITVSAQCNRVPVLNGHFECTSVRLASPASPEEAAAVLNDWPSPLADFNLPTAPAQPVRVFEDPRYPQPRRHSRAEGGMQVSVGKVQACPAIAPEGYGIKFVVLSHNTIRGAAGGAILNAELLHAQGRLAPRSMAVAG